MKVLADQFDDDVDFRVVEDLVCVPAEGDFPEVLGELGDIDVGHSRQDDVGSCLAAESLPLFEEGLGQAAADGAKADYAYADVVHMGADARGRS